MRNAPLEVYIATFIARCDARRHPAQPAVDQPGLRGLLACAQAPVTRLLVIDDRAHDALAALLPDARAGMIDVFSTATRCTELVGGDPAWKPGAVTAMSCRDLRTVSATPLLAGLSLRTVRRRTIGDDAPDAVALEQAVASAIRAAPAIGETPRALAAYLRSLPAGFSLFAAVDGGGVVRATSGAGAFGPEATVIFVNTEHDWRGRGIGGAMTAAALRAARAAGARRASLDASNAGLSLYLRLGFEVVGPVTRFSRSG